MGRIEKLISIIMSENSDNNVKFKDIRTLLLYLGFEERINGSHHIYRKSNLNTLLNIQKDGDMAKSYQIKQVRKLIISNNLWNKNEKI